MCLNIKIFYLTAAFDYFKYIKMPLEVFPVWIKKQYDLDKHVYNGYVYLRMERAVWGLPQAGILANKLLQISLCPTGIMNASTLLACGITNDIPFYSPFL
jgi:hypothetical protein